LGWAIIDYDDVNKNGKNGFWNLSKEHTMFGNASFLLPFKLMPLEKQFRKSLVANWSFNIIDMSRRMVAFIDQSQGQVNTWQWDFGDGTTSKEQHPIHQYSEAGKYVVVLWVQSSDGKSRRAKIWDVAVK
jgi:PKD repeat protein